METLKQTLRSMQQLEERRTLTLSDPELYTVVINMRNMKFYVALFEDNEQVGEYITFDQARILDEINSWYKQLKQILSL